MIHCTVHVDYQVLTQRVRKKEPDKEMSLLLIGFATLQVYIHMHQVQPQYTDTEVSIVIRGCNGQFSYQRSPEQTVGVNKHRPVSTSCLHH